MRRLLFILLAAVATACAPAQAATLQVSPPLPVAAGAGDPVVVALPAGGWALAWAGTEGVHAVVRDASGAFGEVQRLSASPSLEVQVAAGPDGRLVAFWLEGAHASTEPRRLRFAVAPPGERFGEAGELTRPPDEQLMRPRVAVAADRTVFLGFKAYRQNETEAAIVAVLPPDGPYHEQTLWPQVVNGPDFGVDAAGGVVAMWSGSAVRERMASPRVVQVAERAPGQSGFGPPQTLSPSTQDADNNYTAPRLAVGSRGDAVVAWSPMEISSGPVFPSGSSVSHRPAGGAWSPAENLHAAGTRPHVAVNGRGVSIVVSQAGPGLVASYRPAAGAFAAEWPYTLSHGIHMHTPVALDDAGNAVAIDTATPPAPVPGIVAAIRPAGGCLGEQVNVSPPGVVTGQGALALRGDGSGVVAWTDGGGVKLADLRVVAGGREGCPKGQTQPGVQLPPTRLSVSRTPGVVTRKALRKGLRLRVRAAKRSAVGAAIMPEGRTLEKLAKVYGKTGRRGVAALRIRLSRKQAAALRRGARLEMWIWATAPGHGPAAKIRKFTVR